VEQAAADVGDRHGVFVVVGFAAPVFGTVVPPGRVCWCSRSGSGCSGG
jgi:hypothetical protein